MPAITSDQFLTAAKNAAAEFPNVSQFINKAGALLRLIVRAERNGKQVMTHTLYGRQR